MIILTKSPVRECTGLFVGDRFCCLCSCLSEYPDDSVDLAEDLAGINDDGIHGVVLGLESDVIVLFVEGLDRCGIINECNNHFTVLRGTLLTDDDAVAAEDTGIYHGIPLDIEHEGLALGKLGCGEREVLNDIVIGKKRLTRSDIAVYRNAGHLGAHHLE